MFILKKIAREGVINSFVKRQITYTNRKTRKKKKKS